MTEAMALVQSGSAQLTVLGGDGGMEGVLSSSASPAPSLACCLGCCSETTDKTYLGGGSSLCC